MGTIHPGAVKKVEEKKLDVAEVRMLRWMSGVTKMDRIRNERIRGTTMVGEISKKVQESRLKWCGHVLRRIMRRQESGGDGGAGVKNERKTETEVDNIKKDLSKRGSARLGYIEASHKKRWPHIKVGKERKKKSIHDSPRLGTDSYMA